MRLLSKAAFFANCPSCDGKSAGCRWQSTNMPQTMA
jgi:hypothetical protein